MVSSVIEADRWQVHLTEWLPHSHMMLPLSPTDWRKRPSIEVNIAYRKLLHG
jgi:hypothetical protein